MTPGMRACVVSTLTSRTSVTSWVSLISMTLLASLASPGCGGNAPAIGEPLGPAPELAIVAHQGDDLLFLQPELRDAVQLGTGVTTVYITAGDREDGSATAAARHDGATAAYTALAGARAADWSCGQIELAGHAAEHCRLDAANISLVFLGYPDGGHDGAAADSLLHLWEAQVDSVAVIGQASNRYDQRGLIAALAAIIDATAPTTLRTLEIAATHGDDHSDHMLAGALAVLATAASASAPAMIAYRGDNIAAEPANVSADDVSRSTDVLARFAACTGCGSCGGICPIDRLPAAQLDWLARRYPVGMQRPADGVLRLADGCVTATVAGDNASIVDCAAAPTWHLGDDGTLRASTGVCLDALLTGELVGGPCSGAGPGGRYFLDDEGHLWSGAVPAPQANMAFAHLDCVISTGGRPRAALCGATRAPTVEIPASP